ncbi:MAG: hypothetical protein WD557_05060 [Dehalococcoidia bacterium]
METNGNGHQALDADAAERVVGFLANQDAIAGATLAAPGGALLASRGSPATRAAAPRAAFICERAAEVVSADDLRGMGKLVSESQFERLAISGPKGEALVMSLDRACLILSVRPGGLATAVQSASPVISRFGPAAAGRQGG